MFPLRSCGLCGPELHSGNSSRCGSPCWDTLPSYVQSLGTLQRPLGENLYATMRSAYHQPAFGGDSLGCSDRAACSIVTVYLERMISTFTKFRVQVPISVIFSATHFRDLLPLLGGDGVV